MDILRKDITDFSFDDIVAFCKQLVPEGVEIDYKKDLSPKGLSKHFAAFSNTRGGIIIIGVDEDKDKGVPVAWDGVKNPGPLIEKIHQCAADVDPIPSYTVCATPPKDGHSFVLVRILESDNTPHYGQNDANLWIRTGSISKQIDRASPEQAKTLFAKAEKSGIARQNYIDRADATYNATLAQECLLDLAPVMLTIAIQPFFPEKALITPQDLHAGIDDIQFHTNYSNFPAHVNRLIPEGTMHFRVDDEKNPECEQLYSTGLLFSKKDVLLVGRNEERCVRMNQIAIELFSVIFGARNFYNLLGYKGCLDGFVSLENVDGVYSYPLQPDGHSLPMGFNATSKAQLLDFYDWPLEFDTTILNDDKLLFGTFYDLMKKISWAFEFPNFTEALLKDFVAKTLRHKLDI